MANKPPYHENPFIRKSLRNRWEKAQQDIRQDPLIKYTDEEQIKIREFFSWLDGSSGREFLREQAEKGLPDTPENKGFLDSPLGKIWLQEHGGKLWLSTDDGYTFLDNRQNDPRKRPTQLDKWTEPSTVTESHLKQEYKKLFDKSSSTELLTDKGEKSLPKKLGRPIGEERKNREIGKARQQNRKVKFIKFQAIFNLIENVNKGNEIYSMHPSPLEGQHSTSYLNMHNFLKNTLKWSSSELSPAEDFSGNGGGDFLMQHWLLEQGLLKIKSSEWVEDSVSSYYRFNEDKAKKPITPQDLESEYKGWTEWKGNFPTRIGEGEEDYRGEGSPYWEENIRKNFEAGTLNEQEKVKIGGFARKFADEYENHPAGVRVYGRLDPKNEGFWLYPDGTRRKIPKITKEQFENYVDKAVKKLKKQREWAKKENARIKKDWGWVHDYRFKGLASEYFPSGSKDGEKTHLQQQELRAFQGTGPKIPIRVKKVTQKVKIGNYWHGGTRYRKTTKYYVLKHKYAVDPNFEELLPKILEKVEKGRPHAFLEDMSLISNIESPKLVSPDQSKEVDDVLSKAEQIAPPPEQEVPLPEQATKVHTPQEMKARLQEKAAEKRKAQADRLRPKPAAQSAETDLSRRKFILGQPQKGSPSLPDPKNVQQPMKPAAEPTPKIPSLRSARTGLPTPEQPRTEVGGRSLAGPGTKKITGGGGKRIMRRKKPWEDFLMSKGGFVTL